MKRIQPLDAAQAAAGAVPIPKQRHHNQQQHPLEHPALPPAVASPAVASKSRLKRLLERQFPALHRAASTEKLVAAGDNHHHRAATVDPGSLCLEKLVHNFLEGENSGGEESRPCAAAAASVAGSVATSCSSSKCGRSRCNCFLSNGCWEEESPEDGIFDFPAVKTPPLPPPIEASLVIKNLLLHTTSLEKSLLSDVSTVLDKPKHKLPSSSSGSGVFSTKTRRLATLVEGLTSLGHDASICHSRWGRTASVNAGQHEYADVLFPCGERLIVDIDFKSEFEVAHPTKEFRAVLAVLPAVFVGTPERLKQVVAVAAPAAKRSLRKKGFHVAPWRTEPYMQAKWLSPAHERIPISAALAAAKGSAAAPFTSVPVVADAGCWGNFGAVATASVVTHWNRPARVAPGVADQDQLRGVNARAPAPATPAARSRAAAPPPPAAMRRVGWAVPGSGYAL